MNIYDEAYALAKALKESDEQKCLVEAEKALKTNPDAKKMTAEYRISGSAAESQLSADDA